MYTFLRYDIHWNVTYSLSSDPSQAQDHECGPGPFTFESFVVNTTYRVLDPLVNQGWTPDPVEQPNAFTTISTASILTSVSEVPLSSATTSAFFGGVNGAPNRSTMGSWTVLCMIFFMISNVTLKWILWLMTNTLRSFQCKYILWSIQFDWYLFDLESDT